VTRRRALVTLGVWLVLSVALGATHARPAVVVIGAIVGVVSAATFVMFDLLHAVMPLDWTRRPHANRSTRVSDQWAASLRTQLGQAKQFGSTELRDTLVDLVDDRLLVNRHIDRATDPVAAMDALSPPLRRLVAEPPRPVTSWRELRHIVTQIEALSARGRA
jgi:hypothetical protein